MIELSVTPHISLSQISVFDSEVGRLIGLNINAKNQCTISKQIVLYVTAIEDDISVLRYFELFNIQSIYFLFQTVCALAQACPIVTLEYWRSITDRLNKMQGPYPDVKDFLPPLKETTLINKNDISFLPNLDRKKLFSGMTFIAATSRQLKLSLIHI